MRRRLGLVLAACLAAASAPAQDGPRLGGAFEGYAGLTFQADPAYVAARSRADLLVEYVGDRGRIFLQPRLTADALADSLRVELREAHADAFFRRADVRVGHQLITWGRTDGAFVTDLLAPLDLSTFLAQPFDDLRLGVTAVQIGAFAGDWTLTGIAIPRRPTSRLPEPGSRWFPAPETVFGVPVTLAQPDPLDETLAGSEAALRLAWRGLPRSEVSVLWINGFNRIPAFRKEVVLRPVLPPAQIVLTPVYRRRHVLGLSAETLAADPVVLRAEAAFHTRYLLDQRVTIPQSVPELLDPAFQDAAERGFLLSKPFLDAAVGAQRAFGTQTVSVQALGRLVLDHDERVAADRFEPSVTVLWLGRFFRDTVTLRTFALYNLGKDFWVNPELSYAVQDGLNASLGAQVFGGVGPEPGDLAGLLREPSFRFSAFRDNSFAYVRVRYAF